MEKKQNSAVLEKKLAPYFNNTKLADTLKQMNENNPLMTQRLGADPYAIVYEGRVYVYMTGDVLEYDADGKVKNNSYSLINTINVISSADLVNWTDHGTIYAAGASGAAKWGNNSWAPAAAYKKINGKTKFFLYFANSGNGIGVITSDSPTGPFTDPINKALVSRSTPNCANVEWLFDPAVLVDEDGRAYLYVGGGVPGDKYADPGTARVVELGDDMISLKGDPVKIDVPYLFEDSGIHKIGDTYYYTYCTNFNVSEEDSKKLGIEKGQIAYMTSKNPMGPFKFKGGFLKNPGVFFGCWGNNHHCVFKFKNQWYITYHSQVLESKFGLVSGGYRCTHIDTVTVNEDGSLAPSTGTKKGVDQIGFFNPFVKTEAETMATMGGIHTTQYGKCSEEYGSGNMIVTDIHTGDWIALKGAEFGDKGAASFTASVKAPEEKLGAIQIRLDSEAGEVIGYMEIESDKSGDYKEITTELLKTVKGKHNLYFIFYGEGYNLDYWQFNE